jgi:hypothetical protein
MLPISFLWILVLRARQQELKNKKAKKTRTKRKDEEKLIHKISVR